MSDVASAVKSNPIYAFVFLILSFSAGLLLAYLRGPQTTPTEPLKSESLATETLVTLEVAGSDAPVSTSVGTAGHADWAVLNGRLSDVEAELQRLEKEVVAVAKKQVAFARVVSEQEGRPAEMLPEIDTTTATDGDSDALDTASSRSRLEDDLARLGARPTERGYLVTLTDSELRFPVGGSALLSERPEGLEAIAEVLARDDRLVARVEGHTDRSGSATKNLTLSRERARSVADALAATGVDAERIEIVGMGEARPIDAGRTAEARQRNRRVEVYLIER
ncbi:OmpA family protein [Thiocapsa bogorovii]|uniref:OmpA family protein n=1 Tax=Thiocapsa bogorovii TaxID=521689 RepID=UPI001E54D49E|nr:OmpA family protein [Thiocapsa bogorovii]UHD17987.1 OmpA family protein [Thiocapsa bogorovii]